MEYENKHCLHCKKPLVKMGTSRKNGGTSQDWKTRKYHKKCYKEIKEKEELMKCLKKVYESLK